MGCIGCFNDFGGPWDIIDDLDDVEIDGDRLLFRRPTPRERHLSRGVLLSNNLCIRTLTDALVYFKIILSPGVWEVMVFERRISA